MHAYMSMLNSPVSSAGLFYRCQGFAPTAYVHLLDGDLPHSLQRFGYVYFAGVCVCVCVRARICVNGDFCSGHWPLLSFQNFLSLRVTRITLACLSMLVSVLQKLLSHT